MSDEAIAAAAAAATAAAAGTAPAVVAPATTEATPAAAAGSSAAATASAAPAAAAGLMDEEIVQTPEEIAAATAAAAATETARLAALTPEERAKEEKAAADAAAAKKAAEDKAQAEAVVYTDVTMPDGVTVDGALLDKAKETFSAQGLTQVQAQAMVDLYAGDVGKMIADAAAKPYEAWRDTQAEWTKKSVNDAEFGGAKLQASKAHMSRAIDTFLNKDEAKAFRAAMAFTGATNNPDVIRFMVRAGQRVSEGKFVTGNGPPAVPKSTGAVLFDNPTSQPKPAA